MQDILAAKAKPFNQVSPDTLVIDALNMLSAVNLSYLVVMENNAYKGVFSERDYSRNVILKGRHSDNTKVADAMTTDLPVVGLTDTLERAMHLIDQHKIRYLLAFDRERFCGVITVHDLLRQVLAEKDFSVDKRLVEKLVDGDEGKIY